MKIFSHGLVVFTAIVLWVSPASSATPVTLREIRQGLFDCVTRTLAQERHA